ncbi:MAG: sulfite exporter TauE/SafE family protein [Acidimicrobiales bacterium]
MTGAGFFLLVAAGVGGGLAGSIAGLASLVSYPALLATGLSPLPANVTNTVALVFSSIGSVHGSRPELLGQSPRVRRLGAVGLAGGITGGALLLATPPGKFELIVPWLVGAASLAILAAPTPQELEGHHQGHDGRAITFVVFLIAVYGGYFGAAAGVFLLAALLVSTADTYARSNAVKNVVLGLANGVAALAFVLFGPVRWSSVLPLAAGFLLGGRVGPVVVRRAPAAPLRVVIALAGVGLAVRLGIDAYGT